MTIVLAALVYGALAFVAAGVAWCGWVNRNVRRT